MRSAGTGRIRARSGPPAEKQPLRTRFERGGLALVALTLGYFSFSHSLANVIVKVDPQSAYALAPNDGRIIAAHAWEQFSAQPSPEASSQQSRLAARALLKDPTAVEALSILGLQAQLRSEDALADRIFAYSVALSRRELAPQIWAIEVDVARGDIVGALHNYDLAMRTSQRAREVLFPVLASAIVEPRIRANLIKILATGQDWSEKFIGYVPGRAGLDPRAVAAFLVEGTQSGLSITDAERVRAVGGLVSAGQPEEAWAYYRTFRPDAKRDRSRDPEFRLGSETPAPFDWKIGVASGLSAAILEDESGGILDFSVPPGSRATVVSQMQLLPPGRYRLVGRSSGIAQPQRSRPFWTLVCASGRELGRVEVPNSQQADSAFSGEFTVPSDCAVQVLSLVAPASDDIAGSTGQIRQAQLLPQTQ